MIEKIKQQKLNGQLYLANIFHCVIFVFFIYFSRLICRRDQFTVSILRFGIEDFTDPQIY